MNPLRKLHEQAEAEFQAYGEVDIVSTFGEPQAEYAAVHKSAAVFDLAQRGILEVRGKDRTEFLNRSLTNDLRPGPEKKPMAPGAGAYAFLLNNKGRIVADMNVLERGDCTWLESDARNIATIQQTLSKFVFSEKVEFANQMESRHELAIHGPAALGVVRLLAGELSALPLLGSASVQIFGQTVVVWRDDMCGVEGYMLVVPSDQAAKVWMALITAGGNDPPGKRLVRPAGWAILNTARIEAGRPLFGIDFDDTALPAETGQIDRAVSFTKGCYLGQEIVARMHSRGQVARKIVGVRMLEDALPMAGAAIVDETQAQIGGITSSTISPILSNAGICLGLLKSTFAAIGTEVKVAAEGAFRRAVVAELPFVKSQG